MNNSLFDYRDEAARPTGLPNLFIINSSSLFTFISLTIDMALLRFLRKTILPQTGPNVSTIAGQIEQGIMNRETTITPKN